MEDCFGGEAGVANLGTGVQLLDVEYLDARIAVVGVVFLDVDTGRGGRLCQTSLLSCWASPWTSSLTAGTPTPTYGIATITYRSLQQNAVIHCMWIESITPEQYVACRLTSSFGEPANPTNRMSRRDISYNEQDE